MFKKIDGYYWVKESATSKIGFKSVFGAIDYAYPAVSVVLLFGIPSVIATVIVLLSK